MFGASQARTLPDVLVSAKTLLQAEKEVNTEHEHEVRESVCIGKRMKKSFLCIVSLSVIIVFWYVVDVVVVVNVVIVLEVRRRSSGGH